MALSLNDIQSGPTLEPPRILLYGVQGVGKSGFSANAPSNIFIQTEDGLGSMNVKTFPLAETYEDVIEALNVLVFENHEFKTLTIDSADWLEPLIWDKVCRDKNVNAIDEIGYGKGYKLALTYWREILGGINWLRLNKGMIVIMTAHAVVKKYTNPEGEDYDRYHIKLHEGASALCNENFDCVFFANYLTHIKKEQAGFGQEKAKAIGGTQRFLYTQEHPAYVAKNRYDLPEKIELDKSGAIAWGTLCEHIPYLKQLAQPAQQ